MGYVYRYERLERPLQYCPTCHGSLREAGSISVTLNYGEEYDVQGLVDEEGQLDETGTLSIASDGIWTGNLSLTTCARCGERLQLAANEIIEEIE